VPQIVAMGGGGFSEDEPGLARFVLRLAATPRPRVCHIPTAAGDDREAIEQFHAVASALGAEPFHLALFARDIDDLRGYLLGHDVIHVGGGNTANMLAVWRVHGVDEILREAWNRGIVLCGVSAGALCWFEGGSTDSFGGLHPLRDGLGILPGSFCPHYDGEPMRRSTYHRFVADGLPGGYAADDGAAVHVVAGSDPQPVASRPGARVYRVELDDGQVRETPLATAAV
jgi:dipeptidase E